MPDLKTLQSDFITAVRENAPYPHGNEPERIAIYRRNLDGGLVSAMEITYPVILKLVGEDFFRGSIRIYREQHMPDGTNLDQYGAQYPAFLEEFEPAQSLPYLPDVARLEWAYHRATHADNANILTPESLPQDPEALGEITLPPHPATQLLTSPYPVLAIWEANQDNADDDMVINLDESEPDYLLVTRPELTPQTTRLTKAECAFLRALLAGETIYTAFENAIALDPGFDLVFCLQKVMVAGSFM